MGSFQRGFRGSKKKAKVNEEEKKEKKDEKGEEEKWKKDFESFMKKEASHLENKPTVFPEEIRKLANSFLEKHKDVEVKATDVVGYAKELLGMEEA
jgi:hypothetical protein